MAARQQLTHEWWSRRRPAFDVYVSELVIAEAAVGDAEAVQRRAALLAGLPDTWWRASIFPRERRPMRFILPSLRVMVSSSS
jgi:hypothetical protein